MCTHVHAHIHTYMCTYTREHVHVQHRELGPEVNENLQKFITLFVCVCTYMPCRMHEVRGLYHVNPRDQIQVTNPGSLSLPTEPSCQLLSFNLFVFEIRSTVAQADSGSVQPRMTLCHVTKLLLERGIYSFQLGIPQQTEV